MTFVRLEISAKVNKVTGKSTQTTSVIHNAAFCIQHRHDLKPRLNGSGVAAGVCPEPGCLSFVVMRIYWPDQEGA